MLSQNNIYKEEQAIIYPKIVKRRIIRNNNNNKINNSNSNNSIYISNININKNNNSSNINKTTRINTMLDYPNLPSIAFKPVGDGNVGRLTIGELSQCKLWVGDVPRTVTSTEFHNEFIKFCDKHDPNSTILEATIQCDKNRQFSLGYGWIIFSDAKSAKRALNAKVKINGCWLTIRNGFDSRRDTRYYNLNFRKNRPNDENQNRSNMNMQHRDRDQYGNQNQNQTQNQTQQYGNGHQARQDNMHKMTNYLQKIDTVDLDKELKQLNNTHSIASSNGSNNNVIRNVNIVNTNSPLLGRTSFPLAGLSPQLSPQFGSTATNMNGIQAGNHGWTTFLTPGFTPGFTPAGFTPGFTPGFVPAATSTSTSTSATQTGPTSTKLNANVKAFVPHKTTQTQTQTAGTQTAAIQTAAAAALDAMDAASESGVSTNSTMTESIFSLDDETVENGETVHKHGKHSNSPKSQASSKSYVFNPNSPKFEYNPNVRKPTKWAKVLTKEDIKGSFHHVGELTRKDSNNSVSVSVSDRDCDLQAKWQAIASDVSRLSSNPLYVDLVGPLSNRCNNNICETYQSLVKILGNSGFFGYPDIFQTSKICEQCKLREIDISM